MGMMICSLMCTGARYRVDVGGYAWGRLAAITGHARAIPVERREYRASPALPPAQPVSVDNQDLRQRETECTCRLNSEMVLL